MARIPTALRIRNALEDAIVRGDHAPGAQLDPEAIEAEFNCSRTPVREALHQLEASGFVRVQPKRGTFVTSWTAEELAERFEVMAEIEASCGRLATRRITADELADLQAAHEDCRAQAQAGNAQAYYQANSVFHHCIYRATHNAFLMGEAARLHAILQPYRRMQLHVHNRMMRSFQEHDQIVAAIRAGDPDETARVLRAHVIVQGDRFHDMVAALRQTG